MADWPRAKGPGRPAGFAPLGFALLAACGGSEGTPVPATDSADRILCAVDGAAELTRACWVEQFRDGGQLSLVIRTDAGSFRRFDVLADGRGVATADGADAAQVALADGGIEVTVAGDRYRLPAKMSGDGGQ
jgi:hypothetical protein